MKPFLFITALFIFFSCYADSQIIVTIGGNGIDGYDGDGDSAVLASFNYPGGITIDKHGNLFITDVYNNVIREINTYGIITTIAGNGFLGYSGDGGKAIYARLNEPTGLTFDDSGNLFFTDYGNSVIRKINTSGIITTIAGLGTAGYNGDSILATSALLNAPSGIKVDSKGNIYFADALNERIRKINSSGIITTIAGNGIKGYSGDGGIATIAELDAPVGINIDTIGNFYITDKFNARIRKIDTNNIITTIAGTGTAGYSGDGGLATSAEIEPSGDVLITSEGIYISDQSNNRIRKIDSHGIINTIAGNGIAGYSGDGGVATLAELNIPTGIVFDSLNNLYLVDSRNQRIREVIYHSTYISNNLSNEPILIYPNPVKTELTLDHLEEKTAIILYNNLGEIIYNSVANNNREIIHLEAQSNGIYFLKLIRPNSDILYYKIVKM